MPYVESSIVIEGDAADVYALAKEMEAYPGFMKDVETVKVIERNGDGTVTEWATNVDGLPICWKERDVFDDQAKGIKYQLIEGDLDKFEGEWTFEPVDGGTKVTLTVDFDFGMPTLADLVGPILEEKVKENSQMMLAGMKSKIEGGGI